MAHVASSDRLLPFPVMSGDDVDMPPTVVATVLVRTFFSRSGTCGTRGRGGDKGVSQSVITRTTRHFTPRKTPTRDDTVLVLYGRPRSREISGSGAVPRRLVGVLHFYEVSRTNK